MTPINNYEIYNSRMASALDDKIFYRHLINECDLFIDYGCGDGSLIIKLAQEFSNKVFVGIERDPQMRILAANKIQKLDLKNVCVINTNSKSDYLEFKTILIDYFTKPNEKRWWHRPKTIINFSSVMHEVLSYSSYEELNNFWEDITIIFNMINVKYITFRDMCVTDYWKYVDTPNELYSAILRVADPKMVQDFVNEWGTLKNYRNAIHFILKADYKENWSRELYENYLAIPSSNSIVEAFKSLGGNIEPIEVSHYTLPYLQEKFKRKYNFDLNVPTHIKFILKVN